MKRRNIGISIIGVGLLAGAFLAGTLMQGSGGSAPATSGNTDPTANIVLSATATPTKTAVTVQDDGEDNPGTPGSILLEETGGSIQPAGPANGGNQGSTGQPAAPESPVDEPEQPAPVVPEPEAPEAPEEPAEEPAEEPEAEEPFEPAEEEPLEPVNEAPYVMAASPATGETGVALDTAIEITFSEKVDIASAEAAFSIVPNVPGWFSWTDQHVMTFTPDLPFDYNTKVEYSVAQSVQDAEGLSMEAGYSGSFMVLRQKTISLYSQPARDGHVFAPPVNALQPVVTASNDGHASLMVGSWMRGFLSFDLAQLPATTVDITHATLHVHQRAHHAEAYTAETGALWAVSLPYGDLDAGDYAIPTPTICPGLCYPLGKELSSNAADGWKSTEVTPLVRADWNNSAGDINAEAVPGHNERLSQFRLQFLNENMGAGPDVWAEFHAGESGNAPRLEVTFVYP